MTKIMPRMPLKKGSFSSPLVPRIKTRNKPTFILPYLIDSYERSYFHFRVIWPAGSGEMRIHKTMLNAAVAYSHKNPPEDFDLDDHTKYIKSGVEKNLKLYSNVHRFMIEFAQFRKISIEHALCSAITHYMLKAKTGTELFSYPCYLHLHGFTEEAHNLITLIHGYMVCMISLAEVPSVSRA